MMTILTCKIQIVKKSSKIAVLGVTGFAVLRFQALVCRNEALVWAAYPTYFARLAQPMLCTSLYSFPTVYNGTADPMAHCSRAARPHLAGSNWHWQVQANCTCNHVITCHCWRPIKQRSFSLIGLSLREAFPCQQNSCVAVAYILITLSWMCTI